MITANGKGARKGRWRLAAVATVTAALLPATAGCERLVGARPGRPPVEGEHTVPLQVVEAQGGAVLAFVPVYFNGQGPFTFALDTGASNSVVDVDVVRQTNLTVTGRTTTVTGVIAAREAETVRADQWRIGDVPLPARTLIAIDLPGTGGRQMELQGLLGSDILSDFGAVTVDYDNRVLILSPHQ